MHERENGRMCRRGSKIYIYIYILERINYFSISNSSKKEISKLLLK